VNLSDEVLELEDGLEVHGVRRFSREEMELRLVLGFKSGAFMKGCIGVSGTRAQKRHAVVDVRPNRCKY